MVLLRNEKQQLSGISPRSRKDLIVESKISPIPGNKAKHWIALSLCAAVLIAGLLKQLVPDRPDYADSFAPVWISFIAAGFAAAGIIRFKYRHRLLRVQRALLWGGILLMVWTANGLLFDLLRLTPLMPPGIDWPGMATRSLALAAVVALARIALARPEPLNQSARLHGMVMLHSYCTALPDT